MTRTPSLTMTLVSSLFRSCARSRMKASPTRGSWAMTRLRGLFGSAPLAKARCGWNGPELQSPLQVETYNWRDRLQGWHQD
eukprot:6174088-Pleurochrysis_carterae.AAC.1